MSFRTKYTAKLTAAVIAITLAIAGCAGTSHGAIDHVPDPSTAADGSGPLPVVTSFSILSDIVSAIGHDRVSVHNLVPLGTAPHLYEPLPADVQAATDAQVLIYGGLNLEGGHNGWFFKLTKAVDQDPDRIFEATAGVAPQYLTDDDGRREVNPHAFIDPVVGITMTENIRDALISSDPANAAYYRDNAATYLDELADIATEYETVLGSIPVKNRVLVTSERAFQYLAHRYEMAEGYIWAVDTDENGSPEQITTLIDFLREHDAPALFVESNVDTRPMETVSAETGIPIGGVLYSDEIGKPGSDADTYVSYLRHNISVMGDVLGDHS